MSEHNMYELVKTADARGGSRAHAKWLQDHMGDHVRCRLVATQLAIGEKLDVAQCSPPLMVARLFLAIASLHVDENEARDWCIGFGDVSVAFDYAKIEEVVYVHTPRGTCPPWYRWKLNRAVNVTRADSRAWRGFVKDTLVRDGATTVEAVPLVFMLNDGHVVTVHDDDFIASDSQQGLDSLHHVIENNFHTELCEISGPHCGQKSCKFFQRTVEFADGATRGSQTPGTCRNASTRSAWPQVRRPRRWARPTR